jgi:SAM-dependent methyltransferase
MEDWIDPAATVLEMGPGDPSLGRRLQRLPNKVAKASAAASRMFLAEPTDRFDVAVSSRLIETFPNPDNLVRYAFNSLRGGGLIIIETPYHGYLKNLCLSLFNRWDRHLLSYRNWDPENVFDHDLATVRFWRPKSLKALLERHGFRVVKCAPSGGVPGFWAMVTIVGERPKG